MFPKPQQKLTPNSFEFESQPLIKPTGFREYDVRWLFGDEINLMGIQALGMGLGTLINERGVQPDIVVGHDFRSYSSAIKMALTNGLMASGITVHDIGLSLSPMAYFAQFELDISAVAMVTASHNDNGWTGVKMGINRPLTFGPDEMQDLKQIVLNSAFKFEGKGGYEFIDNISELYVASLINRPKFNRKIKAVVACGNGTAGEFAPSVLEQLGIDVVPLDCDLDYNFPNYNPNPEDLKMLQAIGRKVIDSGADVGLGFDGDGDRCGVVDNHGTEIFADKVGVLIARDIAKRYPNSKFVVDVKSTGLFKSDPILKESGTSTEYYKTGHSYMKQRVVKNKAIAGFEKSGHFFFNEPIGRGYDDGLMSAISVLDLIDHNQESSIADLHNFLPKTWNSPTMSPFCPDELKYGIVDKIVAQIEQLHAQELELGGNKIAELNTINGIRVSCEDGTWGLIRASSNKPELVIVVESPVSELRMKEMFQAIDQLINNYPEVGEYNQKLK